jgi:hypothetical protein
MRSVHHLGMLVALLGSFWHDRDAIAALVFDFDITWRRPTTAEIAGGVPVNSIIRNYYFSTDEDILGISKVHVRGVQIEDLYRHTSGHDVDPPPPRAIAALPALGAHTFIDTPGNTTQWGLGLPGDGTDISYWGDVSNDGPQSRFRFLQLTLPEFADFTVTYEVALRGALGPENVPVHYAPNFEERFVPEPTSSLLLCCAAVGLNGGCRSRRATYGHAT